MKEHFNSWLDEKERSETKDDFWSHHRRQERSIYQLTFNLWERNKSSLYINQENKKTSNILNVEKETLRTDALIQAFKDIYQRYPQMRDMRKGFWKDVRLGKKELKEFIEFGQIENKAHNRMLDVLRIRTEIGVESWVDYNNELFWNDTQPPDETPFDIQGAILGGDKAFGTSAQIKSLIERNKEPYHHSTETRKKQSEAMKKIWAERKKKASIKPKSKKKKSNGISISGKQVYIRKTSTKHIKNPKPKKVKA